MDDDAIRMNPFSLRFADRGLEAAFAADEVRKSLRPTRVSTLVALVIACGLWVLSDWTAPQVAQARAVFFAPTFAIVATLALALALTWTQAIQKHYGTGSVIVMCAIAAEFAWGASLMPTVIELRTGMLILMVIHTLNVYNILRPPFPAAIAGGWLSAATYVGTLGYAEVLTGGSLLRSCAALIFANLFGMLARYQLELSARREFLAALENVRLFNETKQALERQTATADILRAISSSPTSTQPVFDAIAKNALALCRGMYANVFRYDSETLHFMATESSSPRAVELLKAKYPMRPDASQASGRVILTGAVVRIEDSLVDPDYDRSMVAVGSWRRMLGVPMLREGTPVGVIVVTWEQPGPILRHHEELLQTFADQAVIAIENVRLFNETREALEQQRASAEVLRVISASISDTTPVFDKITESCEQLFAGDLVGVTLVTPDNTIALGAYHGPGADRLRAVYPLPLSHDSGSGAAILDTELKHYPDVAAPGVPPGVVAGCTTVGMNAIVFAPMIAGGRGVGAIWVGRMRAGAFSDREIALLKTFADQAVIAIENVRLFNETKEALERQTATSEVLRVISSSPSDLQPVFDAILSRAVGLCEGNVAILWRFDGSHLKVAAHNNTSAQGLAYLEEHPLVPGTYNPTPRAALERRIVHELDVFANPEYRPLIPRGAAEGGHQSSTQIAVPLLGEDELLGVITIWRFQEKPYTEKQIALLSTFADQAVIAIENVRLFKELQERTEALTKSVGQLTALGEVGQAISSTLDLETVLKTIVSRAVQLTGLDGGSIYEYDERTEEFLLRATENVDEEYLAVLRRTPIRKGEGAVGRAALTGEPTQIPDIQSESYQTRLRDALIRAGYRAVLVVPLRREEHVIGALSVTRKTPGPFAPEIVELLKTFATQSAMAIQNARLFREIGEKGKQLEVASQHKSQFLASMSHELRTPLNAILGFNEMILDEIYGEVSPDVRAPLENIQASGKHLLRLINNVLDLAKIEAGRMELALSDFSIHDVVESVRSTLRPLAAAKGLELVATLPDDLPLAYGDFGRITQCLMNLAGNSLKFTKAGSVEISVRLNDGVVVYRVADTGIGIPPDKIETLFTEFKQTDATIASEYGGTGLGLAISRKFVEMHGGRIWVESELGKGSAFIFEVPLRVTVGART